MPYTIAICQRKGGVAKTTTALALGACLVEQRHRTLLIDLDPQGNLTAGLGLEALDESHSVAGVLLGNGTLAEASLKTSQPGLDLTPASPDMLVVSPQLSLRPGYEYTLQADLARPEMNEYSLVIIDCPPTLGPVSVMALTAANLVVIPTQCESFSVQGFGGLFRLVDLVRRKTNPQLMFRVLVTMFDKRGKLHGRILDQLRQCFAQSMLQTVIGFDGKLRESQLAGQLITGYAPASRGAEHYRQLAQELLTYVR